MSDELLREADWLAAIERAINTLPVGSGEIFTGRRDDIELSERFSCVEDPAAWVRLPRRRSRVISWFLRPPHDDSGADLPHAR